MTLHKIYLNYLSCENDYANTLLCLPLWILLCYITMVMQTCWLREKNVVKLCIMSMYVILFSKSCGLLYYLYEE